MARGSLIGFLVGIMPGGGATIASFLSYGVEKTVTRRPQEFGQGSLDAVACVESCNNALSAGAMIPLMALAIPGTATTAILLSGFLVFGLPPGPKLFQQHPDIAWGLIASMYVGNVMLLVLNIVGIPFFVFIVKKAKPFMTAMVATITVAGVYGLDQNMTDVWLMLGCGLVGFLLMKLEYPLVPVLLGLVLGGLAEKKPIAATLLLFAALVLAAPPLVAVGRARWRSRAGGAAGKSGPTI
jgi:putative tricarboxylic transport membrane protein